MFIFLFLVLLEVCLRISLLFNLNGLRDNPIVIYNPYCDQNYWLTRDIPLKVSNDIVSHPILSYARKSSKLPNTFDNSDGSIQEATTAFYGTSFIGHEIFKKQIEEIDLSYRNYSLPSYGLDQMYLSYLLTEKRHKERAIVFGFLLEDIDRMLFMFRDYNKVLLKMRGNELETLNMPIQHLTKPVKGFELLSLKSVSNLFTLITNNFNFSASECFKSKKVALLKYIIEDVIYRSDKNNQKLIFLTFRFAKDYFDSNWRFEEVKKLLYSKDIVWIDVQDLLSREVSDENQYLKFYGKDNHLNEKGFAKVVSEINKHL